MTALDWDMIWEQVDKEYEALGHNGHQEWMIATENVVERVLTEMFSMTPAWET